MNEKTDLQQAIADGLTHAAAQGIRCSCGSYFVGFYYAGSGEYERWREDHAACGRPFPAHPPTMLGIVRWQHEPPAD